VFEDFFWAIESLPARSYFPLYKSRPLYSQAFESIQMAFGGKAFKLSSNSLPPVSIMHPLSDFYPFIEFSRGRSNPDRWLRRRGLFIFCLARKSPEKVCQCTEYTFQTSRSNRWGFCWSTNSKIADRNFWLPFCKKQVPLAWYCIYDIFDESEDHRGHFHRNLVTCISEKTWILQSLSLSLLTKQAFSKSAIASFFELFWHHNLPR